MKNGWQIKTIGDACSLMTGGTPSKSEPEYFGGKIKWLVSGDIHQGEIQDCDGRITEAGMRNSNAKVLPINSVMIALNGQGKTRGTVALLRTHATCNQSLVCICPREPNTLLPEFLHANLHSRYQEIRQMTGDSGNDRRGLNMGLIKSIEVPIPPPAEQKRIVSILDEALRGIAAAKAKTEKNIQNTHALFNSHLQSVFTQRGKGWKMEKLDVLTNLARGHNPPKSKFSREPKLGYVRFYQIRDGGTDDYAVYVPDTPQLHKMKKDDIMMVAYRHVGRAFRGVEGAFNVALCKISNARRDLLDDDYLFHMIPSPFVKGELLKRSERSLIPSMSIEHLRELRIPLPLLDEQQRIVKLINSLSTETRCLTTLYERKVAALEAVKRSLLHQAFTGNL